MSKVFIKIRVEQGELDSWRKCAEKSETTLSEWMRKRCNGEGELLKTAMSNMGLKRSRAARKTPVQTLQTLDTPELHPDLNEPVLATGSGQQTGASNGSRDSETSSTAPDFIEATVARRVGHLVGCECYECARFRKYLKDSMKPAKAPEG